jgi:hypothetical protein
MKTTLLFLLVFLISLSGFSQSLEGEWNGSYTYNSPYDIRYPNPTRIRLKFILNKDSSYTVFSNSDDVDFNYVYSVTYKRISPDSIYLQEQRIIEPANAKVSNLQEMHLKIDQRKKSTVLRGEWISRTWLNHRGEISFAKKQDKKD